MRKRAIRIFLVTSLIITLLAGNNLAIHASNKGNQQDLQNRSIILKGGYEAKAINYSEDGSIVDFGAPTYCDDLKTPINTQWYE